MIAVPRVGRVLRQLVRLSCARPALTIAVALALAAAAAGYALTSLRLETSTRALLPPGQPYIERYVEYDGEFGALDDLVIVVEAPSIAEATAYASRLVRALRAREAPLRQISYRIDPEQFEGRGLLFLSRDRLAEIRDRIFDYQDFLEAFAERPTLDRFVEGVAHQMAAAFAAGFLDLGLEPAGRERDLRFVETFVAQVAGRLDRTLPYRSPWGTLFDVPGADEPGAGYFLSEDKRLLFILTEPESEAGSFTGDRRAIESIRAAIADLGPEFPGVRAGVTGKAALSNDEMVAAFRDSRAATALAFTLALLMLLVAFRQAVKPVLMLLVLAVSLGWSFGVATLFVGHLSLFSVMFVAIIIGIGLDYGIYLLYRYDEERFLGRTVREALEVSAERSGPGIFVAAVTATVILYALMLTEFRGIQELGFVGGSAVFLAWLAMMTVFPAVVVLVDRSGPAAKAERVVTRAVALDRIGVPLVDRLTAYRRTALAITLVLTAFALWGLRSAQFDYNLLNLQAEGTESVLWERRILATAGRSGFAALSSADSLEELRRRHRAFSALPSVAEVDSALLLIPEDQDEKLRMIGQIAPLVTPVRIARPMRLNPGALVEALATLHRRLDIAATEAPPGDGQQRLRRLVADTEQLLARLRRTEPRRVRASLGHLQHQIYLDFVRSFHRLQDNLARRPVGLDDLPHELRQKFVSPNGRFLLKIHPAVDIWNRAGAHQFVGDLRRVDPGVTGTAIITHEAIRSMERSYQQGTLYAVILVILITFALLRRARETMLALLPLALGMVWTVGLMHYVGLRFTMGNVFALPLLLAAASAYGLHLVLRHVEERGQGGPLVGRSTVLAVLVHGLTTMVGFGSLMLADHRGIFGLGLLLTLGIGMILLASLVVLPVALRAGGGRGRLLPGRPA